MVGGEPGSTTARRGGGLPVGARWLRGCAELGSSPLEARGVQGEGGAVSEPPGRTNERLVTCRVACCQPKNHE